MRTFNVIAKDKRTGLEMTLAIGAVDAAGARKAVENMPRSMGGGHPGLEVVRVEGETVAATRPPAPQLVAAKPAVAPAAPVKVEEQ